MAERRRRPAGKVLSKAPAPGVVRVAQLIAAAVTPRRFRSKRQFRPYCGLAVEEIPLAAGMGAVFP